MSWYQNAVIYHIYPLGLTGAPMQNPGAEPVRRLASLYPWVDHLAGLGFNALYIGPLFESVGHGYETTDYRKLDSRLGTNEDLRAFVSYCHGKGVRVILDAVFNHTGREFFAFRDLLEKRETSPYRDWYRNVNFRSDNGYHDGLSYETWGGYELLAKLNLQNPEVVRYHLDTVRFWVEQFDIDGLRLDAADVLDFGFMQALRQLADRIKPEFWLMGEVIHGEYARWVNDQTLHSVTNYRLHKALFSSHNDGNYFELAHTVEQLGALCGKLYSFADNHDVERIQTRLRCKADYLPVHVLLFTLPGVPSVYYGSEFAVEGKKELYSDASLRPALRLEDYRNDAHAALIGALAGARRAEPALRVGSYEKLALTTGYFAFARRAGEREALVAVNNSGEPVTLTLPARLEGYRSALHGGNRYTENGQIRIELPPHGAELLLPEDEGAALDLPPIPEPEIWKAALAEAEKARPQPEPALEPETPPAAPPENKAIDDMTVPELQALILRKLAGNGPVTERMRQDVADNVYLNSLRNWAKSFRT
ncbi:MAG: alpha-glucosidase C-terminal domain-containing protein [Oscillospiraceae bacterium]|nr:alpha-glucosidase C-terminal domain-containing protein [Oscillospiraceae bacterium]